MFETVLGACDSPIIMRLLMSLDLKNPVGTEATVEATLTLNFVNRVCD